MALDGLFLHHLINEIREDIKDKKIFNIIAISDTDYAFYLSNKKTLFMSLNPSHSYLLITDKRDYLSSSSVLSTYFKKHIEGGIIKDINQYENDRLAIITIDAFDDLGYVVKYKLYLELMGKNSNLIITDENDIIQEAIKKSYLTDSHLIKNGIKYEAIKDDKINPFKANNDVSPQALQGISKQLLQEIEEYSLSDILKYEVKPTLIENDKTIFYCLDLKTIYGKKTYFDSLSNLLEYYYEEIQKTSNDSQDLIRTKKYLNKELEKAKNKLEKQKLELEIAKDNDTLIKYANLLKANFHLIKAYSKSISLFDYETNQNIEIALNPKLKPSENIDAYFNKIKKNKRAVITLDEKIKETEKEIEYLNANLTYLDFSKTGDLKEIMQELGLKKIQMKKVKPHLSYYIDDDGNKYYFGKNNVQNNYLTNEFASINDYWFHAKSIPGSHVILKGELNDKTLSIAANIAAYYSKASASIHVCVDYTLVKWVKKIKGEIGSNVIYTHEKTYYADPSLDFINNNAKLN